jgi:ADP-ribose pyrophosphatase
VDFQVAQRPQIVLVIPILDKDHTIILNQYRPSLNKFIIEFPAGKVEPNETIFEAAKRELQEETGYQSKEIKQAFEFWTAPHFTDEKITVFLAWNLLECNISPTKWELFYPKKISFHDLFQREDIYDAKTLVAISYLKKKLTNEEFNY